jgi:threonyl-tRNA synthetase
VAILLEQTKGNLPFWLAPKQINIIPVNNSKHLEYANEILSKFKKLKFRASLNSTNDRLSKKIRDSQIHKNKYQIIIGDDEVLNNTITVRKYGNKNSKTINFNEFITTFI